ncbi:MAG: hypothetical protein JXR19_10510 [Bacteroidia bacterium]
MNLIKIIAIALFSLFGIQPGYGQSQKTSNYSFYLSGDAYIQPFSGLDYAAHFEYDNFLFELGYTMGSKPAASTPDDYQRPIIPLFGPIIPKPKDKLKGTEIFGGYQFRLSSDGKLNLSTKVGIIYAKISAPYAFDKWQGRAILFPNYDFTETHHYANGLLLRADLNFYYNEVIGGSWGLKYCSLPNQDLINNEIVTFEIRLLVGILRLNRKL